MRKWLIAGLLVLMFPWILSLIWMRAAGVNGKTAETESMDETVNAEYMEEAISPQRRILVERDGIHTYMELEDYLPGIVLGQAEVGMETEALKCQAVVARTYICRMMEGRTEIGEEELDLTYPGDFDAGIMLGTGNRDRLMSELQRCEEAVQATCGIVMQHEDRCILPLFHRISAGRTRKGDAEFPYLQAVESSRDAEAEGYLTEMEWSVSEFEKRIQGISADALASMEAWSAETLARQIQIIKKDDSGYVEQIKIGPKSYTGDEVQYALGLPSGCYSLRLENGRVHAGAKGAGHGYGLSQAGARAMARAGWHYEEILHYYYKNISLVSE